MSLRGFARKLATGHPFKAVGELFKPEPPRREPPRESPQPPQPRGGPPLGFWPPVYDPDTDTWRGIGRGDWRRIKDIAEKSVRDGMVYHTILIEGEPRQPRGTYKRRISEYTLEYDVSADVLGFAHPSERYADIIDLLETGEITPDQMLRYLRDQRRSYQAYANGSPERGAAMWNNRDLDLPEWLYWYHGWM